MALSKITNGGVAASGIPSGGIIQVQRTQFTGTNTIAVSTSTNTVFTDLTVNITPSSTSSIIKVEAMVNGEWSDQIGAANGIWLFMRDSTQLSHPTAGSRHVGIRMGSAISYDQQENASSPEGVYYTYFDSPSSTSQITYKVAAKVATAYTYYLNRTIDDTNMAGYERGTSFICVTEIAG